jgi:hypothetical protein
MIVLTHEIINLVEDNNAWVVLTKSLAKRASFDEYQKCFPGLNTICQDTDLSKPTVIKALKYLEKIGVLKVSRNKTDKGGFLPNQYFIETDKIQTIGKLKLNQGSKGDLPGVVNNFNQGSKSNLLGVVNDVYPNHKSNLTLNPTNQKKFNKKNLESSVGSHEKESPPNESMTHRIDKLQSLVPQPLVGTAAKVALSIAEKFTTDSDFNEYINFLTDIKKPQTLNFDLVCFTGTFQDKALTHFHNWKIKQAEKEDPDGLMAAIDATTQQIIEERKNKKYD